MKIAFVLNLDIRSAIARETLKLCEYLSFELAHEVVIFSDLNPERIDSKIHIKSFSHPEEIVHSLREFEHVVHAIGNSSYHLSSLFLIRKVP